MIYVPFKGIVDNCCCDNVGEINCSDDIGICGSNPQTKIMTGEDAVVLCGEWEIGNFSTEQSGEQYNIILPILEVITHPNYTIVRGNRNSQYVENDIALLKVDDEKLRDPEVGSKIKPACLPKGLSEGDSAIHSGWSYPPSQEYLTQYASGYTPYARDFQRQWHYSFSIVECRDPFQDPKNIYPFRPRNLTDTFYPPGTVCISREFNYTLLDGFFGFRYYVPDSQFCPTSGESGSSLMSVDSGSGKYSAEGILSFVKGCSKVDRN